MDIENQVAYWREGALDDLEALTILLQKEKINHGLFFAHLALEKALKAIICAKKQGTVPLTHNLMRLSQLTEMVFSEEQLKLFARATDFNLHGRYALPPRPLMTLPEAKEIVAQIGALVQWLTKV